MKSQDGSKAGSSPDGPTFRCPHSPCEKTFFRREHLTRHEQSHSAVKPHKCPLCPKAFARSDILKRHIALHQNPGASKRTLIACFNCRRRKLKCDSNTPCATCVSSQLDCEREETPPAQGQPTTSDIPQPSSYNSLIDWSPAVLDLSIEKFGAQGWCPTMGMPINAAPGDLSGDHVMADIQGLADQTVFEFDEQMMLTASDPSKISALETPPIGQEPLDWALNTSPHRQRAFGLQTPSSNSSLELAPMNLDILGHPMGSQNQSRNPSVTRELEARATSSLGSDLMSHPSPAVSEIVIPPSFQPDLADMPRLVHIYKSQFHPRWPILYQRRFQIESTSPALLGAIALVANMVDGVEPQDTMSVPILNTVVTMLEQMPTAHKSVDEISHTEIEAFQAAIICIIFLVMKEGADQLSMFTIKLIVTTLSAMRQCGIFAGASAANSGHAPLETEESILEEERKRLGFTALRIDTYVSVIAHQPPMLRYEEIGLALPVTEKLWNAISTEDVTGLMWDEPAGRSKKSFRTLVRSAVDTKGGSHRKLRLLESDLHLGLCAIYGRLWEATQEFEESMGIVTPTSIASHVVLQRKEWIEHLNLWRLDAANAASQDSSSPLEFQDPETGLDILNLTLYHIARMDCHCTTPLIRQMSCLKESPLQHQNQLLLRGKSGILTGWTQQAETRVAVVHAAQLLRLCRARPDVVTTRQTLINPLTAAGLFRAAIVLCTYAANVQSCERCLGSSGQIGAPADNQQQQPQQQQIGQYQQPHQPQSSSPSLSGVDVLRADVESLLQRPIGSGWVVEGGSATIGRTPLCRCGLPEIASIYTHAFQSSPSLLRRFQSFTRLLH